MRLLTKISTFLNTCSKSRVLRFRQLLLTTSYNMGHANGFYTNGHNAQEYLRPNKVSYMSVPGKQPLLGLTVGQLIDLSVEKYGNAYGLIVSDLNIYKTFAQLKQEIDAIAAGFLTLGLTKGDRVGIWGPNSYEYYLTQMACWKAGLVLVNINSAYQPPELLFCLQNVSIQCLVIATNFKTQDFYSMVTEVIQEILISEPGKIQSLNAPEFKTLITMGDESKKGAFTLTEVMTRGETNDAKILLGGILPTVQFDDVCNIQFTSGTTGNPKGAMLTHHNIINNSFFIGQRFQFNHTDRICLTVPLFHCYGSVIGTLVALHYGSAIVIPAAAFSGKASIEAAAKERCTVIYGTPTMHIAMMNAPDFETHDLSSLRLACTAGAICPEELIREMKTKYTVETVGSLYGMTETSPVSFTSLPEDSDTLRAETVGYPMEHCEVKVVDTEGKIVPLGTPGELCTRGYVTMSGYFGDKEKTETIFKPTRWLHTGDMVIMRETGHASIVGRIKDTIIRGGENIYPKEVEEFLHSHSAILEAQVFGIPDYRMGEEVAAWILLKDGSTLTEDQLKTYCKGKIAHYKVPRHIFFVTEFPKTVSGKLQKHKMREETVKRMGGFPQAG